MRTNLKDLRQDYENLLKDPFYEDCTTKIYLNDRGAEKGNASLTIDVQSGDNSLSTTIYMVEKTLANGRESTSVMYVNNKNHSIIWNKIGPNPLAKIRDYVETYLKRSTMRMKGIDIDSRVKEEAPAVPGGARPASVLSTVSSQAEEQEDNSAE